MKKPRPFTIKHVGQPSGMMSAIFHDLARTAVQRARSTSKQARKTMDAKLARFGIVDELEPIDFDKHLVWNPHAVEAIVMAAAALEAGINEIAYWYGPMSDQIRIPPNFFEKWSLEEKWEEMPFMVGGKKTFDRGAEPWQSFSVLVHLRNVYLHYKAYGKLSKNAKEFLVRHRLTTGIDPSDTATIRTARWAVDTSSAMFAAVTSLLNMEGRENDPAQWPWGKWMFPKAYWGETADALTPRPASPRQNLAEPTTIDGIRRNGAGSRTS